jgi:tRNA-splicing endonuclease subunit sen54 N-term
LAAAIWRPQHKAAEVVLQRGRLFNHIGFMWGKKLFLHPEEALYLVDRANLLLFEDTSASGKRLLSLQECQEVMFNTGVTMDMYLVYCKLMRAGYIVQRHPFTWVVKNSESPTQIWSPPNPYNSRNNRLAQAEIINTNSPAGTKGVREAEEEARAAKRQRTEETSTTAIDNMKNNREKDSRKTSWWASTSPSIGNTNTTKITLTNNNPWAGFMDQSTLPRCIVKEPAIHRALRLFPNMQPLHHSQPSEVVDLGIVNKEGIGMLHFDVFHANSQFSRKLPGIPLYSMCVCEGGAPPSILAKNAADQASNGIPVRYAGVEHGDISYFAIARAELHKILT